MPRTKPETSLSVIKPELIAEGAPQVINVDLKPFNKAREIVSLTIEELDKYKVITSKEMLDEAMEVLKVGSKVEKAVEAKRKIWVEPHNGAVKQINSSVKELTEGLPKAIADVKAAALQFQKDEEAKAAKLKKEARVNQLLDMGFEWDEKEQEFVNGSVAVMIISLDEGDGSWTNLMRFTAENLAKQEAKKNEGLKEEDPELYDMLGMDDEMPVATTPVLPAPSTAYFAPTKLNGAAKVWKFEIQDASLVPREYLAVDATKVRLAMNEGVREIAGIRIYQEDQLRIR